MPFLLGTDGVSYFLIGEHVTIGRGPSNDLVIPTDRRVSRHHAEAELHNGQWILIDLDSRNGLHVNGQPAREHHLVDGDRVRFGVTEFVYATEADPNTTEIANDSMRSTVAELSGREKEVLVLVGEGLTDREIAQRLFISVSTVRTHLDRIGDKTGLRRRSELTRMAMKMGLLD